jgi:hypothetical protein
VLGETKGKLLVEPVETTDVGQDDDAGPRRLLGRGRERGEAVSVGRLEHEVVVGDGSARNRVDRRARVEVEAHRGEG